MMSFMVLLVSKAMISFIVLFATKALDDARKIRQELGA